MAPSSSELANAAGLIGLTEGTADLDWSAVSWRDVAALAARERCVALAWLRSRDIISCYGGSEVAQWWRELALRALARGHAHVEVLAGITGALREASIRCAVLKGAPLSHVLYGEPGARASADLDLWVPLDARDGARQVLLDLGWRHADGRPPYDESFLRPGPHGVDYLEVHSTLLHARLSYLPMADPEVQHLDVAGFVLPVMTGSLLPVYLAVHIARHRFAPALWLLDHRALWERLDDDERTVALWTARRCCAHRYLHWVLARTQSIDAVLHGERSAVARVGLAAERREFHPMWRHLQLAPVPDGTVRALQAWVTPPWVPRPFRVMDVLRRVRDHWRSAVRSGGDESRQARRTGVAGREITVGGDQLLRVAREVASIGGRMWITATGTSMHPTLRARDRVLIEPATRVAVGDIVLMDDDGAPLLHRVIQVAADQVTTRGDARMTMDTTRHRRDIVARAIRLRRGDEEWPLAPSPWRRLRMRVASSARLPARAESSAPA